MSRPAEPRPTLAAAWDTGRNNFHLMRLVAAWLVIWSHAWPITGTARGDWLNQTLGRSAGAFAVDLFFLVSGFLVAASVQRHRWRDFLLARALRLYPALIVCVALTACVMGPLLTTSADYWSDGRVWRYVWATASLWRAEFRLPGVFESLPHPAVNGSLWTLPIEGRLYLLLLAAGTLGMLRPWRYLPAWALAMAGAAAFAWSMAPLPQHLSYLCWTVAFFITGTLLWLWRERIRLDGRWVLPLIVAAFLARDTLAFAPVYMAAVICGALWLAFVPRLPHIRRNDLSYGLYLYGWPMQQIAYLLGATAVLSNTLLSSALAFACAALSWFLIERPALALKPRRQPPDAAGAGSGRTGMQADAGTPAGMPADLPAEAMPAPSGLAAADPPAPR